MLTYEVNNSIDNFINRVYNEINLIGKYSRKGYLLEN